MESLTIPLTQGKEAVVDACEYNRLIRFRWSAVQTKDGAWYAVRTVTGKDGKRRTIWMHRYIMMPLAREQIDHRDRDGLNNVRSNLRFATQQQNLCNRRIPRNNTSGYRGVSPRSGRWVAQITAFGVITNLGMFNTAKQAARAYDKAAIKAFGEWAQPNFPPKQKAA